MFTLIPCHESDCYQCFTYLKHVHKKGLELINEHKPQTMENSDLILNISLTWKKCNRKHLVLIFQIIVVKYSGHDMWFGPVCGQHLWQLSRLAWKHKNVNATYLLFILEGIKIA